LKGYFLLFYFELKNFLQVIAKALNEHRAEFFPLTTIDLVKYNLLFHFLLAPGNWTREQHFLSYSALSREISTTSHSGRDLFIANSSNPQNRCTPEKYVKGKQGESSI
jgi:hypothetical protein